MFKIPNLSSELVEKDVQAYQPKENEESLVNLVKQRYSDMKDYRKSFDSAWTIYNEMIEAILKPYGDDRSKSTVPLVSALTELFVADAIKIQTNFNVKCDWGKKNKAKLFKKVRDYDWRKNNRKKELYNNEYVTAWFWHSVIYTGFEENIISQHDVDYDEDGNIQWKKKEISQRNIILKNIDPRFFYLDNQAFEWIEDANDCIYILNESYDEFVTSREGNKLYSNMEFVWGRSRDTADMPYKGQNEWLKRGKYVKTIIYWNKKLDIYCEIANDVLVRAHPIISTIDWIIALPFVIRTLGKKVTGSYGGRWFCEAALMFNSELNNLREMIFDWIRKSNSPTLMIWNGLEFNWRKFSFNNEILQFNGQLQWNFEQVAWQAPNQAIFSYLERIYKDIAVFVWIDINNILWTPQQTAYQTNVQIEASQKRINVWITNRDLAFERLANLHKDNLQKFFPLKDAQGLLPKIELEDERMEKDEEWQPYFKEATWETHMVEISPEDIREDVYMDVYTDTTRPPSNIADRQAKLEFAQSMPSIINAFISAQQAGVDISSILPLDKTIRELAEDFGLEVEQEWWKEEVKKKAKEFTDMLSQAMPLNQMAKPIEGQEPQAPQAPTPPLERNQPTVWAL